MSLEKAIQAAQTSVPECLAVGYVDMQTGMLLAVKTVDSHPSEVLDLVALHLPEIDVSAAQARRAQFKPD